ncbi:MAG: peptidase M12 [Ferruginibacter sp.]|nr:peptidase M12 [Ferruginibacter sp.]
MKISDFYYCRECRVSHHRSIKDLKNSFLEKPSNLRGVSKADMSILEDYARKNLVKKPAHFTALSRMASERSKEWEAGRRITVSFLGGKKEVRDRVIRHAKTWMNYANIEFDFTPRKKPGDVRIAFDKNDGSWSLLGTDILSEDKTLPTMNLGWLTPKGDDEEYSRVVLHEFGHTLGCIHEHERPDNGIPWNKKAVYAYYKQTNDWTKREVDEQVFSKYDKSEIRANKLDKKSIMMYEVPEELTIGDFTIESNVVLSEADKKFIAKLYPKK